MLRLAWVMLAVSIAIAPTASAQPDIGECINDISISSDHDARIAVLSWPAVPGAAFYDIHRTIEGGPSDHIGTVPATNLSFTDSPAPEGIIDYRVASDGHPTEECFAVTVHFGGQTEPPEQACVSGLTLVASSDGNLLSWPSLSGAISYDVLRSEASGPFVPFALRPADATSFMDTSVTPGTRYAYAVSANGLPGPDVRCEEISIVAVPYFPHVIALFASTALALAVGRQVRRR